MKYLHLELVLQILWHSLADETPLLDPISWPAEFTLLVKQTSSVGSSVSTTSKEWQLTCLNIFLIRRVISLAQIKIWNNIYRTIWVPKQIQILILDWKTSSILASIHWKPTTSYAWTRKSYILALVGIVFDIPLQMEDSIWMPHHFLENLCRTQSILYQKFY